MDNSITYTRATLNEVHLLVDLRIMFALELSGKQTEEAIHNLRTQMMAYFSKAIEDGSCISFIAKYKNEIAGIGSIAIREQPGNFKNPSGKWAYIMNMYTKPEFRRKGICKGVLNALVEEAKQKGINAFELHATKSGEPVYVQNGFQMHYEPTYRMFVE